MYLENMELMKNILIGGKIIHIQDKRKIMNKQKMKKKKKKKMRKKM